LQLMLDNALCPEHAGKIIDKATGKERNTYPAIDKSKLIKQIGERVEQQIAFKYIQECFPDYFNALDKIFEGGRDDQPRSSSSQWRTNMKLALKRKADNLRAEGNDRDADRLEWKPFGNDSQSVGDWLYAGVMKYAQLKPEDGEPFYLFQEYMLKDENNKTRKFTNLSPEADKYRSEYLKKHKRFIVDDLPMLCPPVDADTGHYGSWLTSVQLSEPFENKGELRISKLMLDYINRLQSIPYKINPFVAAVMDYLVKRNRGLGKFVPHFYQEPLSVKQALGVVDLGDRAANTKELIELGDKFKEAKKDRCRQIGKEVKKVQKGRQSLLIWTNLQKLKGLDQFYYPYQWDFRSRAYCRCSTSPQPQGTDYSKAAIQFAEEQPIDDTSKFYVSVELANTAGKDKVSFSDRVKWVEKNQENIILVATCMDEDGDPEAAMRYLETLSEPWQFLAAADTYYHCFILKDRKTTGLRCGVDMSCSAAGIHAGWKRDKADAEAVNVTPGTKPQDLYLRVWSKLLEINRIAAVPAIRPAALDQLTELGYGRKLAKKMVMVFQYSAGIRKQMEEFYQIHDELPSHLQLNKSETKELWKLWPQATEQSMSVDAVISWFQARVTELHKMGKKEILIPNATGAVQVMRYPLYEVKQVKSFHTGRLTEYIPTGEVDLRAWKRAITANATHMCDAAILAIGLHDFDSAFSTVHDAAYTYPNKSMQEMLDRLRKGYVEAVKMDIWDEFRKINGLPLDPATAFPKTNTLDLDDVLNSDYIFA
jgi:hypothetical protein